MNLVAAIASVLATIDQINAAQALPAQATSGPAVSDEAVSGPTASDHAVSARVAAGDTVDDWALAGPDGSVGRGRPGVGRGSAMVAHTEAADAGSGGTVAATAASGGAGSGNRGAGGAGSGGAGSGGAGSGGAGPGGVEPVDAEVILRSLVVLRAVQDELARIEPDLIAAARRAGVSWQALAPALGVASRQAAERRYLRSATATAPGHTRDGRVRAERDERAGTKAVARWANAHSADLRRIAGQISGLTDLPRAAEHDLDRLHAALGHTDAAALPALLAEVRPHLEHHPHLAGQIDEVTAGTTEVRRRTGRARAARRDAATD
ncbi:hypothetical protein GCM10020218_045520 [Dactylosporangium vinaceum]